MSSDVNKEEVCQHIWDNFGNWIHCICIITFDLELGQALESIYPKHITLTKQETSNICYLAFPDSNSGCMGDTTFVIRVPVSPGRSLRTEHVHYNRTCPTNLEIQSSFLWGYVYFRQVKDITLPRGYFQKSVVILTHLPFNNLFGKISNLLAPEYFENGDIGLETACHSIERWPSPMPGESLNLPLLGTVFQINIPQINNNSPTRQTQSLPEPTDTILTSLEDLNYFQILQPVLSHVHLLWELILTSEPLVVMATSPTYCSQMVLALTKIISPLKFCGDFRPYFTIHDSEFKQLTSTVQGPPPIVLGVTNPFFTKILHHWPNTIRLGSDLEQAQKIKLKKLTNPKSLDNNNVGVYTTYKSFLQKDKTVIKKIMAGISSKRPSEVQSAMLRRHLLELTESFMIPLERYMAKLMPLQKNISPFKAAPTPLPFNPDDFFATLETSGPQLTTGIKGDWVGLYKKFFRSLNFNGWFNKRHTELAMKLKMLQLESLSNADLKDWVQGKPEVEVVDMLLRIQREIDRCKDRPVNDRIEEKLHERMHDIVGSLPDDLKNILQVT